MKRCPVCGARYPGSFTFCDQDGAALKTVRRWTIVVAAGTLAIVALSTWSILFGPAALRAYVDSHVSVGVADVSMHVTPAGESALDHVYALVKLRVKNTTLITPVLDSSHFDCMVSDAKFAELDWPSEGEGPRAIPKGATTELEVKLRPKSPSLTQVMWNFPEKGVEAKCAGYVRLSVLKVRTQRDLSFQAKLW